jgi:small subunit ribosomal protein S21
VQAGVRAGGGSERPDVKRFCRIGRGKQHLGCVRVGNPWISSDSAIPSGGVFAFAGNFVRLMVSGEIRPPQFSIRYRRVFVVKLRLRDNESVNEAVRRFRKLVEHAGVKKEMRKREFYEKPSDIRRRDRRRAEMRARRANQPPELEVQ